MLTMLFLVKGFDPFAGVNVVPEDGFVFFCVELAFLVPYGGL